MRRPRPGSTTGNLGVIVCAVAVSLIGALKAEEAGSPTPTGDELVGFSPAQRRLMEALVLMEEERYAEAIPLLEEALRDEPTLVGAWQALGWAYWFTDRPADTEALWRRLAALNPDLPDVHAWLASLAARRGDLDRAAELLEKAIRLAPDSFDYRLDYGRVQMWRGRLGAAIQVLQPLSEEDPDRLDVVLELARALSYAWRYDEARPLWQRLHDTAPQVAEYRIGLAYALLHTGERARAVELAESVLREDPGHIPALRLLADEAEYGPHPERARPYLYRAIEAAADLSEERRALRLRLVTLLVRLHRTDPLRFPLEEAIRVSRDRVRDEPGNVDARLLLAELLLMDRRFDGAEGELYAVLREYNPNNLRARRALFEIALARFQFDEAREHLERMRAFNPRDPYLLADEAQFFARAGRFKRAHARVDELERRGGQGAVAVLRYQVLTPSEIGPALPVRRFREQMEALSRAGYRFLSVDEIPEYLALSEHLPEHAGVRAPTRAVAVTFDGALEPTTRLATTVAMERGAVFTQFVPVAELERGDPLTASWVDLREYRRTGRWVFGSLLWEAHNPARVYRADVSVASALANRIQRPEGGIESYEEYVERIRREYERSRDVLAERLGRRVPAVAYPDGDIGQRGASNEPRAPEINSAEAERCYPMAFLLTPHGHAVATDDPYRYGRYEPLPWMTGEELVRDLLAHHPVFMAQRLRIEYACFQGRRQLARETLRQMARAGYPPEEVRRLDRFIQARLARKFDVPEAAETARKAPWQLLLEKPYIGVHGRYFHDSLKTESWRAYGEGGLHLTSHLVASLRAGGGRHTQPRLPDDRLAPRPLPSLYQERKDEVDVLERAVGVEATALLPRHFVVYGALEQREFHRDARWDVLRSQVGLQLRPHETLELKLDYEHDAVPGGRALVRQLEQDCYTMNAVWSPSDRWEWWGAAQRYDFSDGNRRTHWYLNPLLLVWQDVGLRVGLRYEEVHAEERDFDYWTPFHQRGGYLEGVLRGSWRRHYYSLVGRAGVAREGVRPADWQAYDRLMALYERLQRQSRAQKWPRKAREEVDRALDDLRRNPPESDWKPVFGVEGQWILRRGLHWEWLGLLAYGRSPNYREFHAGAGLRYRF